MERRVINILNLYSQAFGVVPSIVNIEPSFDQPNRQDETQGIFNPELVYDAPNGARYFSPTKLHDYQLPNEPIVSFSTENIIESTELTGSKRKGNVNEIIGRGAWRITIEGICYNYDSNSYPVDQVDNLNRLRDYVAENGAIKIVNGIAAVLNIENVIIKNLDLIKLKGHQNAQPYVLTLISDEPFTLIEEG